MCCFLILLLYILRKIFLWFSHNSASVLQIELDTLKSILHYTYYMHTIFSKINIYKITKKKNGEILLSIFYACKYLVEQILLLSYFLFCH